MDNETINALVHAISAYFNKYPTEMAALISPSPRDRQLGHYGLKKLITDTLSQQKSKG